MRSGIPPEAILLGLGLFLVVAAANVLTPLLPLVQRDFGIDYASAGLLVSAFGLARLALDLPAGFLQQRLGSGRLATLGLGMLIGGSALAAVSPRFEAVVVGRVGMGFGSAIVAVVVLSALSDLAPTEARARVLAVFTLANNTGIGFFPIVGGLLGALWGWRSTMVLCAVLAAVSGALLARVLPRAAAARRSVSTAAVSAPETFILNRWSVIACGALFFGVFINFINRHGFRNTALPLFAGDQLGLSSVAIASGITLMAVIGLLVAIPGSIIADRWSRRGVICAGFLVLALGDLAFLQAKDYPSFLLAAAVLGLGDFFSASQTAALTEAVPAAWRSRILGAYRFTVDLGAAVGPALLASLLQTSGYVVTVVTMAALLLLAAFGALIGALAAASSRDGGWAWYRRTRAGRLS